MRPPLTFVNMYAFPDEAATAQLLADAVAACSAVGARCRVVSGDRAYGNGGRRWPKSEQRGGVCYDRVSVTGFGRTSRPGRLVDYGSFLIGAVRELLSGPRPAAIVGMSTPPILGALAVLASRIRGCPSVYWVMDVYPDLAFALGAIKKDGLIGRMFAAISRWVLRHTDVVIVIGESMAARVSALGARRVEVLHNWADEVAIAPQAPAKSGLRMKRGWANRLVILYSGNLGLAHTFDTILKAAERLASESRLCLAFCGSGVRLREVEEQVAQRGLQNVEILPAVSREILGDSLAAGDIHLVTLRDEVQGLLVPSKIFGILAAGRPVLYIGPSGGEVFDIVIEAGCGICVRNGDVDAVVAAILQLSDSGLRSRMGIRARRLFEERFTRSRQTARLARILTDLGTAPDGSSSSDE